MNRVATQFAPTLPLRPLSAMKAWMENYRQRKALAALPIAAMQDIGPSKNAPEGKAGPVLWDAPDHWSK